MNEVGRRRKEKEVGSIGSSGRGEERSQGQKLQGPQSSSEDVPVVSRPLLNYRV